MIGYRQSIVAMNQHHPDAIRGRLVEIVGDSRCASYIFANPPTVVTKSRRRNPACCY